MSKKFLFISSLLILFCRLYSYGQTNRTTQSRFPVPSVLYTWKSVPIGKGGFVDGIIFHPKAKGVRYCRTDIGGAYQCNVLTKKWEPLLDWLSYEDRNLMGVESIALDLSDPNFVILACGTYTNPRTGNGAILRSFDKGKTFQRTDVPFKFGGNENGRGNGERMAVDPGNNKMIYLGTRHNGLWRSADKGKTWNPVESFPDVTEHPPAGTDSLQRLRWMRQDAGSGIIFVLFNQNNKTAKKKGAVIYVGVSLMGRNNLFKSDDDSKTWQQTVTMPQPNSQHGHIAVSADGSTWMWTPQRSAVYLTQDKGTTWNKANNIPGNLHVVADKVNPLKFYAFSLFDRALYTTSDGGKNFQMQVLSSSLQIPVTMTLMRGDPRGGQDRVYATPGREGDLWLALYDGLYHSVDEGRSWTKAGAVQEIHAFGFGKAAPGKSDAALYLVGVVNVVRGIFRSEDGAEKWVRINDDEHHWGFVLHITGDPKVWGRVYIVMHGRGIVWGRQINNKE